MLRLVCLGLLVALASCAATGDAGDSDRCPGECVPTVADPILDKFRLVWIGEGDRPECPHDPTNTLDLGEGFAAPSFCPRCECEVPAGSCDLPTELRAHTAACWSGGTETSFDAPMNWDGSCTPLNGIGADMDCGGELCLRSLTVAELNPTESSCMPVSGPPGGRDYTWKNVRVCAGEEHPACDNPTHICAPERPPEFQYCVVVTDGDVNVDCPEAYPQQHDAFRIATRADDFVDDRACNPCQCAKPTGGTCLAQIHLYSDKVCSTELANLPEFTATSAYPVCHDIAPAGAALLSKRADPPQYFPGSCAPFGGEELGTALPINPVTICCR